MIHDIIDFLSSIYFTGQILHVLVVLFLAVAAVQVGLSSRYLVVSLQGQSLLFTEGLLLAVSSDVMI
jgi:hypothetical protein